MSRLDPAAARRIAEDWIDAWNAHEIERILEHYADPLEFVSPLVIARTGRVDGTIRNRADLAAYFAPSLGPGSALRFELTDVLVGVASFTTCYRNHRGQAVAETAFPDHAGRAARVYVHHRPAG